MTQSNSEVIVFECKDSIGNIVQITDCVVVCPMILSGFSRPLWHTNPFASSFQSYPFGKSHAVWRWVNKGEVLTELNINIKADSWFRTKFVKVAIKSPVSGLIIQPTVDFDNGCICEDGFFPKHISSPHSGLAKILIPTNELVPGSAFLMYDEFCDFCLKHKNLFLKEGYSWESEEGLMHAIERQRNATIRTISLLNDLGKDYLDDALRKIGGK